MLHGDGRHTLGPMRRLLIGLCAALFSGCASPRIYLPAEQCQRMADRLRTELDAHKDPDPYRCAKGLASFDEFKKRCAEGNFAYSDNDVFGRFETRGYSKTEAEMRHEYEALLRKPVMDPNRLIDLLPHVTIAEGYVLDYAYCDDELGRFPVIYARPARTPAFADWAAYTNSFGSSAAFFDYYWGKHFRANPDYLDVLRTDSSPASFFELALLVFVGEDFYRTWHATWNDRIFCTPAAYTAWEQSLPDGEKRSGETPPGSSRPPPRLSDDIRKCDFRPYVSHERDTCVVSFVSMDDRNGVERQWWTFTMTPPHRVIHQRTKTLVAGWASYIY